MGAEKNSPALCKSVDDQGLNFLDVVTRGVIRVDDLVHLEESIIFGSREVPRDLRNEDIVVWVLKG